MTLRNLLYAAMVYVLYLYEKKSYPEIIPIYLVKFNKTKCPFAAFAFLEKKIMVC